MIVETKDFIFKDRVEDNLLGTISMAFSTSLSEDRPSNVIVHEGREYAVVDYSFVALNAKTVEEAVELFEKNKDSLWKYLINGRVIKIGPALNSGYAYKII